MKKKFISLMVLCFCVVGVKAQKELEYRAEIMANAGSGSFAPYYIMSNNHGILSQPFSALAKIELKKEMDYKERFSFGYGASVLGGYQEAVEYSRYDKETESFYTHDESPAPVWIQQLYAEAKYRGVFMIVGLKEGGSKILNDRLSSGDLTYSANSRPMPGVKAGFWSPQNIPFTKGWVQISGELGYYKQTDSEWLENHFNYFNSKITTDIWYCYKYCYFHTKPSQPFSLTIGMQAASQFGGVLSRYNVGKVESTVEMKPTFGTFVRMLVPNSGGTNLGDQVYYEGNHLGSWDVMGRYRLNDGSEVKLYYQSPWEDGSGIGMFNGFDGLYGVELKNARENAVVTGAVVEYMDLMNQGGPIHWEPNDVPDTQIVEDADGADNYYNNYAYAGYQYYGMTVGSPVLKSPIYNTDGYLSLTDTRLRSVHAAVEGNIAKNLRYRAKVGYTKSWGTVFVPISKPKENASAMVECVWNYEKVAGLCLKVQLAMDKGTLYGDNFGALVSVSYRGLIKF